MGDSEVMEAEEELETLQNPVSLLVPANKTPEVSNLFSSSPNNHRSLQPLLEFFLWLDSVEYPRAVSPRWGTSVGFDCDDDVHPIFNFGPARVSRLQASTSEISTRLA